MLKRVLLSLVAMGVFLGVYGYVHAGGKKCPDPCPPYTIEIPPLACPEDCATKYDVAWAIEQCIGVCTDKCVAEASEGCIVSSPADLETCAEQLFDGAKVKFKHRVWPSGREDVRLRVEQGAPGRGE